MNREQVNQIVNAVLYEGFLLYPYRASSKKNARERFTFGRVYPHAYSVAQGGAEPEASQTECLALVQQDAGPLQFNITVKFLQPLAPDPQTGWQDAQEREIPLQFLPGTPLHREFSFPLTGEGSLQGRIEVNSQTLDSGALKITVRVSNRTPVPETELADSKKILERTFTSTHVLLQIRGGEFLSLTDPPEAYHEAAEACQNRGTWPVLLGDASRQEKDTLLASPIILYDYPQIAPESPGDLHDGTEIDEILSLRIRTLSDQEKLEMSQVHAFARNILERTENLSPEQWLGMHGTLREVNPLDEQIFGNSAALESVALGDRELRCGDRVRIRPKQRADAMDMALAGKVALIEALEQDAEGRVHLALVLDEDPGRDLGLLRQPGHRFFYNLEEVEPIGEPS